MREKHEGAPAADGYGTILDYEASRVAAKDATFYKDLDKRSDDELRAMVVDLGAPLVAAGLEALDHAALLKLAIALHRGRQIAKEGRAADHEHGVLYQAPWEMPGDGFSEHARRCALALAATGVPVHLRSSRPRIAELDPGIEARCAPVTRASIARYSFEVHQLVPTSGLMARMVQHRALTQTELRLINRCRIFSTVWERSPAPADDVAAMNAAAEVWVACQANARMLQLSGVTRPIHVIPIPHAADDPLLALRSKQRTPGPPRFYHIGKWEPRKAPREMLVAFLWAFRPGEAVFILKTSAASPPYHDYPQTPADALIACLEDERVKDNGWTTELLPRSIFITARQVPEATLRDLHRVGDVYVTLSRGEGFDMPAYDAKIAGNRMVFTPSGGPQDYAHSMDFMVHAAGEIPTHPFYNWPGSYYLNFHISAAAEMMRAAAVQVRAGNSRALSDLSLFTAAHVGALMRRRLEAVADELGGKVY